MPLNTKGKTIYVEILRDIDLSITERPDHLLTVTLINRKVGQKRRETNCGLFTKQGLYDWLYYFNKYGVLLTKPIKTSKNPKERYPPK